MLILTTEIYNLKEVYDPKADMENKKTIKIIYTACESKNRENQNQLLGRTH